MLIQGENLCQACRIRQSRYTCPGCSAKSCSMGCVQQHKQESGCSGRRNPASYVSRREYKESAANLDYGFLQAVERDMDNASRHHAQLSISARREEKARNSLVRVARREGVVVRLAPMGLKRQLENRSCWNSRKKLMMWSVELIDDSGMLTKNTRTFLPRVASSTAISDIYKMEKDEGLHYYLVDHRPASKRMVEIGSSQNLKEALEDKTVLEYPTIHISKERLATDTPIATSQTDSSELSSTETSSSPSDMSSDDSDAGPDEQSAAAMTKHNTLQGLDYDSDG